MWNLGIGCVLGLLIGGAIGGFSITLIQNILSGKIKLPPTIALGPLKLDISALLPKDKETTEEADMSDLVPFIEIGGSATSGCLSLLGAAMVIIGFLLPWFSCRLASLISGSLSGFAMLVRLVTGVLLTMFGTATGGRDLAGLGAALTILLVFVTVFLALTPLMGLYIGRAGLRLIQSPKSSNAQRKRTSKLMIRAAIIGLIPLLCYLTSAVANVDFSSFGARGTSVEVQSASTGLWVTLGGFSVSIIAGLVISTAASLAEQLTKPKTESAQ
jgi:hypothetical protein